MDRNGGFCLWFWRETGVALRKESVDRNVQLALKMMKNTEVALRKESVDRNSANALPITSPISRSPQGERG